MIALIGARNAERCGQEPFSIEFRCRVSDTAAPQLAFGGNECVNGLYGGSTRMFTQTSANTGGTSSGLCCGCAEDRQDAKLASLRRCGPTSHNLRSTSEALRRCASDLLLP